MRIEAHVVARLFRLPILRIEADVRVTDDDRSALSTAGAETTWSRRRRTGFRHRRAAPRAIEPTTDRPTLAEAEALLDQLDAQIT